MSEPHTRPAVIGISFVQPPGPRGPVEQAMLEIWQQVLSAAVASPEANFFEAGGDSLTATQVAARVRHLFGVELPLMDLFADPTLRGMAVRVEAALNEAGRAPAAAVPPLTRADRTSGQPLPLSFSQERMWFLHQLDSSSSAYHIVGLVRLKGAFDPAAMAVALDSLLRRHESLRTTFPMVDGQPVQAIAPPPPAGTPADLPIVDLQSLAADPQDRFARATELALAEAQRPFDLARAPLLRMVLYRLAPDDYAWLMAMHHIISDAWSMAVLGRDLMQAYAAAAGRTKGANQAAVDPQPELPIQFVDFAVWQRTWLQGEALEWLLAYWHRQLDGLSVLELPTDRPRPAIQTHAGSVKSAELDPDLMEGLRQFSQKEGATLSITLLAAFQVLLHHYSGQDDIAVGMPTANRRWLPVEDLIGPFVNTLVMRADLGGDPSFREVLARVRQTALEAYAHQDMPFARLVAELNPQRSLSHQPLVQVMFNVINVPWQAMGVGAGAGAPTSPFAILTGDNGDGSNNYIETDRRAAQFDLSLMIIDMPRFRRAMLEYNTDLFDAATIERLLAHYQNLLRGLLADPDARLWQLPLMDGIERRQWLVDWNCTETAFPLEQGLHELFEAQAQRAPGAVALWMRAEATTAAALNQRANRLAHYLRSLGVHSGDRVALCLPRSADFVAAALGALKAGAAYVPIDPSYPRLRRQFMLEDSGDTVVITHAAHANDFTAAPRVVVLDRASEMSAIAGQPETSLQSSTGPGSPAYVIYTSGSTGTPKGVVGTHRGLANVLHWLAQAYPLAAGEVACFKTSPGFVDAVWEMLGPLVWGVPLVILADETVKDPARFVAALAAQGVTRLILVPAHLRSLLEAVPDLSERLPALRLWIVSGEALDASLCALFEARLPGRVLLNLYGSSETAAVVSAYEVPPSQSLPALGVPIGRPIANSQLYVLDFNGQPAPPAVPGEIYAGGVGLALGYHQRLDLTAERFVSDPFSTVSEGRLYRTGDLGRLLPDGNLLYLGRRDRQVKVRGMRVELDEVTAALMRQPGVSAAAVVARPGPDGETQLVGYMVGQAANGHELVVSDVRAGLQAHLPEFMVPAVFVALPGLPLLPNGKVDFAALPPPEQLAVQADAEAVPPRTPVESRLAQIWAETLALATVGVTDNFFELGGHSLLAVSLLAKVREAFGVEVPVAALFQAPTVEGLAAALSRQDSTAEPFTADLTSLVPMKPRGTRPAFYCIHPLGGGVGDYAALAHHLDRQQPFYGLRARALDDPQAPPLSIEAMAANYVAEVRQAQPAGPYRLGGYSSGGLLAFEMARQLQAAGERVAIVALLDTMAPPSSNGAAGPLAAPRRLRATDWLNLLAGLPPWLDDALRLGPEKIAARLRRKLRLALQRGRAPRLSDVLDDNLAHLPAHHLAFMQQHYEAILAYRPEPYPGRVTLFRAESQALSHLALPDKGWSALALGGVDIREFAGSHHTLLREPYVSGLAQQLQSVLSKLD
jgi:amino acid adenylation domain-containing protein